MAVGTTAADTGVHHDRTRERGEVGDRVAGLACARSREMTRIGHRRCRVPLISCRAAMAGGTAAGVAGVVHRRAGERGEVDSRVTGLAA